MLEMGRQGEMEGRDHISGMDWLVYIGTQRYLLRSIDVGWNGMET